MFTSLTPVIIPCHNWLSTYDTRWKVGSTLPATGVILTDSFLAVPTWTFDSLPRSFFWWMFGKDTDCHFNVFLSILCASHSFKLYKCTWTLFITLKFAHQLPYCNKLIKLPKCRFSSDPCQVHSQSVSRLSLELIWTVLNIAVSGREYNSAKPQPLSKGYSRSYQNLCWYRLWSENLMSEINKNITLVVFDVCPVIVASTNFFL